MVPRGQRSTAARSRGLSASPGPKACGLVLRPSQGGQEGQDRVCLSQTIPVLRGTSEALGVTASAKEIRATMSDPVQVHLAEIGAGAISLFLKNQ